MTSRIIAAEDIHTALGNVVTLGGDFTTLGYALTLNMTGITSLTLPQSGYVVTADSSGDAGKVLVSNGAGSPASYATFAAAGTQTATLPLTLIAVAGAYAGGTLITTAYNLLCVQVSATATGSTRNYTLEMFDGIGGTLLYQATGITSSPFRDNAPFYLPAPSSGSIYLKATNIDGYAITITTVLTFITLT